MSGLNVRVRFISVALGRARRNSYTSDMDSVRFGRVLGIGTRLAAKTLAAAVDAVTSPNPTPATKHDPDSPSPQPPASRVTTAGQRAGEQARRAATQVKQTQAQIKQTQRGMKQGGKRFGEAIWGPFTKAGRVLWLEFTGVFFGIFALYGLTEVWHQRSFWRDSAAHHNEHTHFFMGCLMLAVFGYFTASSFVRARRRSRLQRA
jgi:hypothetical protein